MDDKWRMKICSVAMKSCFFSDNDLITATEIEEMIKDSGECRKMAIEIPRKNGGFRSSKKKMFPCPQVNLWDTEVKKVYISASKDVNKVLVFKNLKDKARLVHIVTKISNRQ